MGKTKEEMDREDRRAKEEMDREDRRAKEEQIRADREDRRAKEEQIRADRKAEWDRKVDAANAGSAAVAATGGFLAAIVAACSIWSKDATEKVSKAKDLMIQFEKQRYEDAERRAAEAEKRAAEDRQQAAERAAEDRQRAASLERQLAEARLWWWQRK